MLFTGKTLQPSSLRLEEGWSNSECCLCFTFYAVANTVDYFATRTQIHPLMCHGQPEHYTIHDGNMDWKAPHLL